MSALGQKRTLVRVHMMSALPLKADIDPQSANVRFVPIADIASSFDQFVGATKQRERKGDAERLASLEIDYQLDLRNSLDRQIRRFLAP